LIRGLYSSSFYEKVGKYNGKCSQATLSKHREETKEEQKKNDENFQPVKINEKKQPQMISRQLIISRA